MKHLTVMSEMVTRLRKHAESRAVLKGRPLYRNRPLRGRRGQSVTGVSVMGRGVYSPCAITEKYSRTCSRGSDLVNTASRWSVSDNELRWTRGAPGGEMFC